jgi:nucleotide-binding universal stress UspA family protein
MTDMRLDRILCAVTFSPSSRRVIDWAASLAAVFDAEVRLFHVMDHRASERDESVSGLEGPDGPERVLDKLSGLARHLPIRVRLSTAVTDGDAADEILQHARLMRADLIAIGMNTRRRAVSPIIRSIAGSAPCPVLAVDIRDQFNQEFGG